MTRRESEGVPRNEPLPGGAGFDSIQSTSWSIVRAAADPRDPERARRALLELVERYRPPVRTFIQHCGYAEADAESLALRFLEKLEEPGTLGAAASSGGRFRTWLLEAVQQFLVEVEVEVEDASAREEDSAELPSTIPRATAHGSGSPPGSSAVASVTLVGATLAAPERVARALFGADEKCGACGALLDELDVTGVCSACAGMQPGDAGRLSFAGYHVIELIGRGGEAAVYRAWDPRAERQVALKVLKRELLDSPEQAQRFRRAAELASRLEHPNIIRIYERGGQEGELPFYTMPLVTGGTLAERQRQERFRDPARAARLMIKIARAVQHAHQHGVLHRDLKPANVLLDLNDEPFVSDFMAKRIGLGGATSELVGSLNYMAPEQVLGKGSTVEADVYGMGAIFHELLTGAPPINVRSFEEARALHEGRELTSPRQLEPHIDRDLDAICSAALHRDPSLRHGSAAVFADSLERALAKRPPLWPAPSRRRRLWLWACRHPLLAVGALLGAALLIVADIAMLRSVRSEERELATATLHNNAALASARAQAVLTLFEKYAVQTARAALDPDVRELIRRGDALDAAPGLAMLLERSPNFDSIAVFDVEGKILARHPQPAPGYIGRQYKFRKYYECVSALAAKRARTVAAGIAPPLEPEVCISPAYRGENSGGIEFTLAAPVHETSGDWLGFVIMNKHARHTLDEIEIGDTYHSGQTTALFGQRDRDRDSPPENPAQPRALTAVVHPELFGVEEHALEPELSRRLREQFGDEGAPGMQLRSMRVRPYEDGRYVDPVTGDQRLAGFAPVGATGFVVAVSTPRDRALGTSQRHVEAFWKYASLLNLGFLILAAVAVGGSLRDGRAGR